MTNYNEQRKMENHFPVFNTRLTKYLMNNGAVCVDMASNKREDQQGKYIYFFIENEELHKLIREYDITYHNDDNI